MQSRYRFSVICLTILFIVLFCIFVFIWEQKNEKRDTELLQTHAAVIASAVWSFDQKSPREYLKIAAQYEHYKQIQVFIKNDATPFLTIEGPKINFIDRVLEPIGLISNEHYSAPIYYNNERIGRIVVVHQHRTIYIYLYVLLAAILLWLVAFFLLRTIRDKHTLEERVAERTLELEKNQERLRQSEKMESIGQLAGGVAHDFNNMLAGILGAAEILGRKLPEDDASNRKMVDLIKRSAQSAAELTAQLLTFSRQKKNISTSIDLHEIIGDAVALLQRSLDKQIEINVSLPDIELPLVCDPAQLQNAFLNLGINAGDAMAGAGTLTIKAEVIEFDQVYCDNSVFAIEPGAFVEITIEDTGTGIDLETQKHIFDPFFTTKEQGKGTGLGLASVYGATCAHHGAITVYSELGRGTVFHLYLPLGNVIHKTRPQATPMQLHKSGTILVIDDEEVIRTTAKITLQDMGFEVLIAENGKEGIELFSTEHNRIDLVILDMIMPKMGGSETFRELQKIDPQAKIVISSGFTKNESISELKEEGLLDFIAKPYHRSELERILAQWL